MVAQHQFKIGDRVRNINSKLEHVVTDTNSIYIYLDGRKKDSGSGVVPLNYELIETEKSKFKVGDRVRIKRIKAGTISSEGYSFASEMCGYIGSLFQLGNKYGSGWRFGGWSWSEEWLELVEDSEVPNPKFKVGDTVKVKAGTPYDLNYTGDTGQITGLSADVGHRGKWMVMLTGHPYSLGFKEDELDEVGARIHPNVAQRIGAQTGKSRMAIDYAFEAAGTPIKQETQAMSLTQKLKQLALGKDEKVLRKQGFKDSEGNWTSDAREYLSDLLMTERIKDLVTKAAELEAEEKANKK